jgi:hypothetical protein
MPGSTPSAGDLPDDGAAGTRQRASGPDHSPLGPLTANAVRLSQPGQTMRNAAAIRSTSSDLL